MGFQVSIVDGHPLIEFRCDNAPRCFVHITNDPNDPKLNEDIDLTNEPEILINKKAVDTGVSTVTIGDIIPNNINAVC